MKLPEEHRCEFTGSDPNLQIQEKSSILCVAKLREWTSISKNHPMCGLFAISLSATAKERKRHAQLSCWWIIHPYSYARFAWDIFMMIVYFISFITIPFMTCFFIQDYQKIRFDNINLGIYAICWLDIIVNCITGFYNRKEREVILHQMRILGHYLTGYLMVDICSSIPYDRLTLPWRSFPGSNSSIITPLINLLPILKLLRYFTLNSYIYKIFTFYEIEEFKFHMFTTLLLFFFVIYWASCFCYVIPILVMYALQISVQDCADCWLTSLNEESIRVRFRSALVIVLENLTGSGYGLIKPKTEGHLLMCTVLMIIGRLFEGYILVMFLKIRNAKRSSESKYQEIVNQVAAYGSKKQLPAYMKKRLLAYYRHRFQNRYFREKDILSKLTDELREEITLHSCRRLVENVAIFQNLPKHILSSIVAVLKPELYLVNDVILKAGTHGDCMFFLASGTAIVLTPTGKEVCHLEDGAHFGEVALLVQDQRRVASVVAIDVCEVYRLDRSDFRKVIAVHSELFSKIERIATERVERTLVIEEQHKRFLLQSSRTLPSSKKNKSMNVRSNFRS